MGKEQQPITITLPRRGLRVFPPAETQEKIARARNGERIEPFSNEEKYRLQRLINCSVLAKRYKSAEAGKRYMEDVDYNWQQELLKKAHWLSKNISAEWQAINPQEHIAILLFGSVAKGLVKRQDHPDPSNIDMVVVGNINPNEKLELLDRIRPARNVIQEEILDHCLNLNSQEANPGNAGVAITNISRLRLNGFSQTRAYITGGAIALHDPLNIWQGLELESIRHDLSHNITAKKR